MKCPFCHADNDKVIDSRASEDGAATRRRRRCNACKRRYTTYERVERTTVRVVKKDGARVPFDRVRLKQGLEKACWKRPISDADLESVVTEVENLGEIVMEQLRELDQVAYVRFASVYREFKDARDFVDELRPMLTDSKRVIR
jgi:transcriptional repressor NrdR